MTKCQITCKSLQKSSKCQNFLRVWHLVILRADQLKKPTCTFSIFLILQREDELNYVEEIFFFIKQPLQKMRMNTE